MTDFEDTADPVARGRRAAEDLLGRVQSFADDDPRLRAGVEQLQVAAREVIAASRALLDLAEELVDDPGAVTSVVGMVGELGHLAGRQARSWTGSARPRASSDDPGDEPPVQRIPVS